MTEATICAVLFEAERAQQRYGPPTSTHEALGVLIEEVGELCDAIRLNDRGEIEREAVQVAAVAYRLAAACAAARQAFAERSGFADDVAVS